MQQLITTRNVHLFSTYQSMVYPSHYRAGATRSSEALVFGSNAATIIHQRLHHQFNKPAKLLTRQRDLRPAFYVTPSNDCFPETPSARPYHRRRKPQRCSTTTNQAHKHSYYRSRLITVLHRSYLVFFVLIRKHY